MLEKVMKIMTLFDFYGTLLTDKQRQALELHYVHDYSLGEIADELAVSRQAVHDIIKRSEQLMLDYESKLSFVERSQRQQHTLQTIARLLDSLPAHIGGLPAITAARQELDSLLDYSKEV